MIETEFSGQGQIGEDAIEQVHSENCFTFNDTEPVPTLKPAGAVATPEPSGDAPPADSPVADSLSSTSSDRTPQTTKRRSHHDDTLGGILTASLLDTPKTPPLKKHTDRLEAPLFINDLAAPEVSTRSALESHSSTPAAPPTATPQSAQQQPQEQTQEAVPDADQISSPKVTPLKPRPPKEFDRRLLQAPLRHPNR